MIVTIADPCLPGWPYMASSVYRLPIPAGLNSCQRPVDRNGVRQITGGQPCSPKSPDGMGDFAELS